MWQFFTERSKKVIQLAHREALRLGHDMIGTEHILMGLALENGGVAAQILSSLGLPSDELLVAVEASVPLGDPIKKPMDLPLSPRAKRVLDLSIREARNMGVNYVGTEHILLGIFSEGEGMAVQVLRNMGLEPAEGKKQVLRFLSGGEGDGKSSNKQERKDRNRTPILDQLGIDLTEMAEKNELDPVIGRSKEIRRVIQVLSRRTKNNPVLIGDPGVGKTAIVEGLAQKVLSGDIPESLKEKRVVQLNMGNLVAGTKYRGEFEERMRKLVAELKECRDVILFIDEIHTIVGAGGAEGAIDAANILKPSLARGEFQVVGATTLEEYRRHIEKDAALERRFQPVKVYEPNMEDTFLILKGLRDRYESHHRVTITDQALDAAVKLSSRYITDRFLPDKGIDLIDEAAARARLDTMELPEPLKKMDKELERIRKEKESAVNSQAFEKAAKLRDDENRLSDDLERRRREWVSRQSKEVPVLTDESVAQVVSEWTGVPVSQLTEEESKRLSRMEEEIHRRLVGQDSAVSAVSKAIRRARSGLKDPKRPIGSFLFLGPTGVGKTEMARSLADFLFGSEDALVTLDMSEFMERHEVSKLIGAPPGYVGHESGGKLTETIRRRPYSVILFDEIEKANPDVFNVLLQILEEGRLTDGQGRKVDFRNTVVIMTSNIGARNIVKRQGFGFATDNHEGFSDWSSVSKNIDEEVRRSFRPEFLNRIDEQVVFSPLSKEQMLGILDVMLREVRERLSEKGIRLTVSTKAKELILEKGYQPQYGARPLRRTIQRLLEDPLADMILDGSLIDGYTSRVGVSRGELSLRCVPPKKGDQRKVTA
ncbi:MULTISPECIES: ATP-dependent Clp protease ATP-binding subunit [Dethiosulfovibrio]|uniref:ATP-dependent Clp protease ATP-binding subunit n=2 Tax=Dethiosulfovibrio TaxID=47054 RepID=A0ABS9EJR8_9BACT|nr:MULTISPECIES: ATP-dependent Clp protease ATP-binding subunit [Dethiosulfovibrio]MCF4112941.1 ATP-dependent Clp protease ATP-binding subunit [Dethiosulfovibrio russensis]MCF4141405.1 ATP-dependent Clp protease ATP-binding subunit [Dethiosulfovibrio marinus]MCF4144361.1 ATP-dependent Clp protease ATP-binding subunit [Dethiosulfovibrio acidaminovorans]MEA3284535.1 ATP-dependent Clp protease ATP-binding subunit [Synergistota bacterium]